jgi:ubiquinone/menaquinone biosynthesis C-methylase UbiE
MSLARLLRPWNKPKPGSDADYANAVRDLIREHGHDKAMVMAVGGNDAVGDRELAVLDHFGLCDGQYLIDVGCGSGRLTRRVEHLSGLRYLGTDISKELIRHAIATCGRTDFRFEVVKGTVIPEQDGVADMVAFFSVATHLMNEQSLIYLEEARRVLRPGGRIVLSFLDVRTRGGRNLLERMVAQTRDGHPVVPINVFFTPEMVRVWADMLGMTVIDIVDAGDARIETSEWVAKATGRKQRPISFGQSLAVLEKP